MRVNPFHTALLLTPATVLILVLLVVQQPVRPAVSTSCSLIAGSLRLEPAVHVHACRVLRQGGMAVCLLFNDLICLPSRTPSASHRL